MRAIYGHWEPKAHAFARLALSFEAGERWTARDVSRRYGVTLRTAQRWLAELETVLPLTAYDGLGHQIIWCLEAVETGGTG